MRSSNLDRISGYSYKHKKKYCKIAKISNVYKFFGRYLNKWKSFKSKKLSKHHVTTIPTLTKIRKYQYSDLDDLVSKSKAFLNVFFRESVKDIGIILKIWVHFIIIYIYSLNCEKINKNRWSKWILGGFHCCNSTVIKQQ